MEREMLHAIPQGEENIHYPSSNCWCFPICVIDSNGNYVFVHNSIKEETIH